MVITGGGGLVAAEDTSAAAAASTNASTPAITTLRMFPFLQSQKILWRIGATAISFVGSKRRAAAKVPSPNASIWSDGWPTDVELERLPAWTWIYSSRRGIMRQADTTIPTNRPHAKIFHATPST